MNTVDRTVVWDTHDRFLECTGRRIRVTGAEVRLEHGITIADESGRCNRNDCERIAGLRMARKEFDLPAVGSGEAQLCPFLDCDTEGGELEILINRHAIQYQRPKERTYWEDRWTRIPFPAEWLAVGHNEVDFRAVGDSCWRLLIDQGRFPDRSAVSEDAGQTWRSDELGENDRADGEYMVRLWLPQHVADGELCSEPVDLLQLSGRGVSSSGSVDGLDFSLETESGNDEDAVLQWRGGSTPCYDPDSWSAWAPVGPDLRPPESVRFVQWRLLLHTADPDCSPVLKRVSLCARMSESVAPSVEVVGADNAPLLRSSYRFASLSSEAERGKRLRERWHLDDVIRDAGTEFDAFLHLRNWVREQWEDGWNMGETDFCPPWDAMVILELASRKLSLGMCTHYATVMSHCCAALGLTARTQIMRSHCINEIWSSEHGKWVAMDVGGDSDDETKFTYHFERDGVPLSALEAHRAWVEKDYADVQITPRPPAATGDRFQVAKRLELFERFMISLRNDELATMGPGEPEHGKISYHFDDYLFWEDGQTERLPWFSRSTGRLGDLYWTVNRARIHLRQTERNRLEVVLETETPNLSGFEKQIDGGDWESCGGRFDLDLPGGSLELAVRPVNAFGRRGAVSRVTVAGL